MEQRTNPWVIIVSVIVTAVVVSGIAYWMYGGAPTEAPAPIASQGEEMLRETEMPSPAQEGAGDGTNMPEAVGDKRTLTDDETGYSLTYSSGLLLSDHNPSRPYISVVSDPLGLMHESISDRAERNREALADGRLGTDSFAHEGSLKLVPLNRGYAQRQLIFSQLEVCSVQFTNLLEFYVNNRRVTVSVVVPEAVLRENLPEYFMMDTANCGNETSVWRRDKLGELYEKLEAGTAPAAVQQWYDAFNETVDSVTIR